MWQIAGLMVGVLMIVKGLRLLGYSVNPNPLRQHPHQLPLLRGQKPTFITTSKLGFLEAAMKVKVEWKCDLIKKDLGDQSAVMDGEFLKPLWFANNSVWVMHRQPF